MRSYDPADQDTDFIPSKSDCKRTYDKLNEVIWGGRLPPAKFSVRQLRGCWGSFVGDRKKNKHVINMCKRYPNAQLFVGTLAHEMIHYWQWLHSETDREVNHGKTFWQWKKKFAQHNLPLQERGGENMNWYASRNFDLLSIYQKTI